MLNKTSNAPIWNQTGAKDQCDGAMKEMWPRCGKESNAKWFGEKEK